MIELSSLGRLIEAFVTVCQPISVILLLYEYAHRRIQVSTRRLLEKEEDIDADYF